MKSFKSLVNASMIACTLALTAVPRAHSADIAMISVGGMVATVAIYGVGMSSYGAGYGLLLSSGNSARLKATDYRQAVDVVAANDAKMMTPALKKFLAEVRKEEPKFAKADDMALLESLVDAINRTL